MNEVIGDVLPWAWAGAVLVGAWGGRPLARPVLDLVAALPSRDRRPPADRLVRLVGHGARRLARRPAQPDVDADRRLGRTVVAGVVAVVLLQSPVAGLAVAAVAWAHPWWRARADRRAADDAVLDELPEVVDLFVLAVGAGLNVSLALAAVAPRARGRLGAALATAQRRVALGERTADALAAVPAAAGDGARPLVAVLVASERYGTPLGPDLERLAVEVRLQRRRRAEESARRLPVKLLFPLVLCTLPAFALLTVVPLLLGAFGSLRP